MKNIFSNTSNNTASSIPTTESFDFDMLTSMLETLGMLENMSFNIRADNLYARYSAIQEASMEIVQEGFGDFIKGCVQFFKSLLEKVSKFFDGVMMFIRAYIGDFDKFLTKYKTVLLSKNPDFTIEGYAYTFKSEVPTLTFIENIVSGYNSELSELSSNMNKGHVVDLRTKYASEEFYDTIRGKSLGKQSGVTSSSFVTELRKEFRSNEESRKDINVNETVLRGCITDYPKLKTDLTNVTKTRSDITSLLNSLMSFFQEGIHVYFKGETKVIGTDQLSKDNYSITAGDRKVNAFKQEHLAIYNSFYDYKFGQARELSHIAIIAMTAKIEALKEALTMYRTIIRRSM